MDINETMNQIHLNNVNKGFWEDKENKNVGELLMLCVSELSEALEAHRISHKANISAFEKDMENISISENSTIFKESFEKNIKNSFEDEIADTVIRLFDLSKGLGVDLEKHIHLKMEYNKLRPYKHGKKY